MGAEPNDAALVARCRAGDDDAWALLVDRFSRYVYAICSQGFRLSQHDAEDVFQDVFTKAYESLGKLRDDSAIRPWLAQLTRRLCIDRLREATREAPVEELEPDGVDDVLENLDEAMAVRQGAAKTGGAGGDMPGRVFARGPSYPPNGGAGGAPPPRIAGPGSRPPGEMK